jgi:cation diffusion facilitator CzcD-associated flavoprotein CzcO
MVLTGHGVLNRPKIPTFLDEELFKGTIMHTARFDRKVPLEGRTVAVIGNGSSGVS